MTSQTQPTVALSDGASMPQFGLGVFQTPPDATEEIVRMAVDEGYRLIDTASMYRNEEGVGKALLRRADVFVTTKLGNSDHGFDAALRAFDESLRRLRLDKLDLYLIHWPRSRVNLYVESWKAFVRLQKEGRVRSIGVSNFNRDHLERIIGETGVTPSVNQIELHPKFQQRALRAFHDEKGVKTESWSPLGRGGLLGEARSSPSPPSIARPRPRSSFAGISTAASSPFRRRFGSSGSRRTSARSILSSTATTCGGSMRSIRPAGAWAPIRPPQLSEGLSAAPGADMSGRRCARCVARSHPRRTGQKV